jgi:hypothetical protein
MIVFEEQQHMTSLPGLSPINGNPAAAIFYTDTQYSLAACRDSFFEYLVKMVGLPGGSEMYEKAST